MNDQRNDRRNEGGGPERDDDAFVARAAALFDDSVSGLDAATRSRLNRGRQRALEAAKAPHPLLQRAWLPAGAAAAVAVLTVSVVLWNGAELPGVTRDGLPASPADPEAVAADFELLLDEDDLEMLEDLEFYSWLDLDDAGDSGDSGENVG